MAAMIAPADGGLGEEAYRGACLDHVGQVRLRVCGYQYHRDRRPVVAFLKCLSKIEATAWLALAFFPAWNRRRSGRYPPAQVSAAHRRPSLLPIASLRCV